ncbi:hypothetical protein A4X09_0g7168 [Tilletia walkeri]|uniref:C2H2-type domain-containing protein n=1 Tax=Tilletia walkeri TaxID=117179 RepID=A0A8X7N3Z9_9BASI|nr:hypothetical protein A4X09_0g7168 [Tilletia walkeri]
MPVIFTPGPCRGNCGTTLNNFKAAKNHWRIVHKQPHPYGSNQGQREPRPLLDAWKNLPSTLPTLDKGAKAIELAYRKNLHKNPFNFLSTDISTSFAKAPWWHHIKADLIHKDNAKTAFISSATSLPLDDGSAFSVDSSLLYSTQADLPVELALDLSAALDIRPTSDYGLKTCQHLIDGNTSTYGHPTTGKKADISMAITPAGHITEVHQDGVWDSSILIQLLREKILFTWPPTPTNLDFAARVHRGSSSWLLKAIEELDEGTMIHLTPGCKFHLPLGTFHAVLSLTPSCLAGYRIHHASALVDIPRLLKWDVETSLKIHSDHEILQEIMDEHDALLNLWLRQRASSIERYDEDLVAIKNLWERDLRAKLNTRLIELSRPSKRIRRA